MAHHDQQQFCLSVREQFPAYFIGTKVLEIGSQDLNGSLRPLFTACDYTGLDLGEGPGVDVVCDGADYDAPAASYDVVLSTECFEHTPRWVEIFRNMVRLTRSGGLIFTTCASTGRPEHGTSRSNAWASPWTNDYYANVSETEFLYKLQPEEDFSRWELTYNPGFCDLYFWGVRK